MPRIVCIGDSITEGVTRGAGGAGPTLRDPDGGYPGRLARLLGTRAHVLGRGIGGATTETWLTDPRGAENRALWGLVAKTGWEDFPLTAPPSDAPSLLLAVLRADRADVVIVLLGTNDIGVDRWKFGPAVIDRASEGLASVYRQARSVAPRVLVATVLPNTRDPAALRASLNVRIRAEYPDFLPLAERFEAAGWERLLGDLVHPNEEGHEVLARLVADELVARHVVSPP